VKGLKICRKFKNTFLVFYSRCAEMRSNSTYKIRANRIIRVSKLILIAVPIITKNCKLMEIKLLGPEYLKLNFQREVEILSVEKTRIMIIYVL
jgi:hypothetical protein